MRNIALGASNKDINSFFEHKLNNVHYKSVSKDEYDRRNNNTSTWITKGLVYWDMADELSLQRVVQGILNGKMHHIHNHFCEVKPDWSVSHIANFRVIALELCLKGVCSANGVIAKAIKCGHQLKKIAKLIPKSIGITQDELEIMDVINPQFFDARYYAGSTPEVTSTGYSYMFTRLCLRTIMLKLLNHTEKEFDKIKYNIQEQKPVFRIIHNVNGQSTYTLEELLDKQLNNDHNVRNVAYKLYDTFNDKCPRDSCHWWNEAKRLILNKVNNFV